MTSKVNCGCRKNYGFATLWDRSPRETGAGRQRHRASSYLLEKIVQPGAVQNPFAQVFQLGLLGSFHAQAFFPLLEPVGDQLVRLPQVVHLGEGFTGEPLPQPAAEPFCPWVPRRWVPFSLAGTRGIVS